MILPVALLLASRPALSSAGARTTKSPWCCEKWLMPRQLPSASRFLLARNKATAEYSTTARVGWDADILWAAYIVLRLISWGGRGGGGGGGGGQKHVYITYIHPFLRAVELAVKKSSHTISRIAVIVLSSGDPVGKFAVPQESSGRPLASHQDCQPGQCVGPDVRACKGLPIT